jgi:hypothetical protein
MAPTLTDRQRQLAQYILLFDRPLASEVQEALQRATLACVENKIGITGLPEFLCGLYLQFNQELQVHFDGDMLAMLQRTFPKHRFGYKGLVNEAAIEKAGSDEDSGFGYSIKLSDGLLRLLWMATRLADAVGRKTSLKDVIAAITLDDEWIGELRQNGFTPRKRLRDFRDVLNVVFFAAPHAHGNWPKKMQFDVEHKIHAPFIACLKTPSGGFAAMNTASMKLNGRQVADISWPARPEVTVAVELEPKNTLEFQFGGPRFGSVEVTIAGVAIGRS